MSAATPPQQATPAEPVMESLFPDGPKTWPHYFGLKVGQRVKTHTGMEGTIAAILPQTKCYHVLRDPAYGGTFGPWEVTPIEATPAASPIVAAQQATLPLPVMDSRVSALRWLLNITTESDRKDVGTRQAAKLLDGHVNAAGRTHRELLEDLWCLLSGNTSITPAASPIVAAQPDERAEFEDWHTENRPQSLERFGHTYKNVHARDRWQGWEARAALATRGGAA